MRLGRLAVEHAAVTGQPLTALWGHKWRIDAELAAGDMTGVEDELAQVTALARSTRLPLIRWHDLRLRASVAALLGQFPEAVALNEEARDLAVTELAQDLSTAGMSTAFTMQHALVTGELARWDDGVMALLGRAEDIPVVLVTKALVSMIQGRADDAATRYEQLRRLVADPDFARSSGVAINMVPLVERFRDATTAQVLGEVLAGYSIAAGGAGVYGCGSMSVLLGRLAVVRGALDEAIAHFEEALTVDTGTGARPAVVNYRVGLAGALLDRAAPGDHLRAKPLLRQALDEARRLGMPGPLRTAASHLDGLAAAARAADPLTAREREIARLVADALTNRQIADRLFLSARTVETHVRNILAKLGLSNRTEIATVTSAARSRG
jgi:DNA-binding CsgD family transcriptional regulator